MWNEREYQERERAARLQASLGVGQVQATGRGFAAVDWEALERLAVFVEAIRRANERHLQTGEYVPLGIAAQDALLALT